MCRSSKPQKRSDSTASLRRNGNHKPPIPVRLLAFAAKKPAGHFDSYRVHKKHSISKPRCGGLFFDGKNRTGYAIENPEQNYISVTIDNREHTRAAKAYTGEHILAREKLTRVKTLHGRPDLMPLQIALLKSLLDACGLADALLHSTQNKNDLGVPGSVRVTSGISMLNCVHSPASLLPPPPPRGDRSHSVSALPCVAHPASRRAAIRADHREGIGSRFKGSVSLPPIPQRRVLPLCFDSTTSPAC